MLNTYLSREDSPMGSCFSLVLTTRICLLFIACLPFLSPT